jgi:uncharacterized membrane protein
VKTKVTLHVGPLPPPEMLERYELLMPGATDRSFTMAEKNQQADIEFTGRIIGIRENRERGNRIFAQCGQVFGFASVVMYFAVLAVSVCYNNTTIFSIPFSAGVVAGIVRIIRSFQKKQ